MNCAFVMVAVPMRARPAAMVMSAVVAGVAVVTAACGMFSDAPPSASEQMVSAFASALSAQDAARAASFTSAPGQAAAQIGDTVSGMHARSVAVRVADAVQYSDGTADYTLKTTWDLGDKRTFATETTGTARRLSSGWRVQWSPSLLAPGLQAGGSLRAVRTDATPAPAAVDAAGAPWMTLQNTTDIVVTPSATRDLNRTVTQTAAVIAPIAPLVTASVIRAKLAASPGQPVTIVSLRDSDLQVLAGNPARVEGVSARRSGELLVTDRRVSTPLTAGVTTYWEALRDATSGWQVQLIAPNGAVQRLAGAQGPPARSFRTTFVPATQLSVNESVVEVAQPASMLVLDARSGAIEAAANNDAADAAGSTLSQSETPGDTLGPVTSAIAATTGGNGDAAQNALHRLGLEVDYAIPGVSTASSQGRATVSAASYDPSRLSVSSLTMGALGVAVARGESVAPRFIDGVATVVRGGQLGPIDSAVATAVGQAMRATAVTGDASDLTGAPGLRALVGTNGPQGPGWFVGILGDKVMVVHCGGEKSGTAALQVVQKYLRVR